MSERTQHLFSEKVLTKIGTKSGRHSSQKLKFHCLAGLVEWATSVYFWPLFLLFKTLLTPLTNCACCIGFWHICGDWRRWWWYRWRCIKCDPIRWRRIKGLCKQKTVHLQCNTRCSEGQNQCTCSSIYYTVQCYTWYDVRNKMCTVQLTSVQYARRTVQCEEKTGSNPFTI